MADYRDDNQVTAQRQPIKTPPPPPEPETDTIEIIFRIIFLWMGISLIRGLANWY